MDNPVGPLFASIPCVPLLATSRSFGALAAFVAYMIGVFILAWMAGKVLRSRSFVSEYFLGSRSLGTWAFALTFAATSASGGTFMGFPSKIYTHGWILALWIASYMVVPICSMGLLGKRLNQVARRSGAITIPDVLRDRFESRGLGLLSVMLIVFFIAFNLVAQFKSGGEILRTLLGDVGLFGTLANGLWRGIGHLVPGVDPGYLLGLLCFAVTVIAYTTYGGFHAVVWTDVMQGMVMAAGVVIMLPLALHQVGGLAAGTRKLAERAPPRFVLLRVELAEASDRSIAVASPWVALAGSEDRSIRLFRISGDITIPIGAKAIPYVRAVELTDPVEIEEQVARLRVSRDADAFEDRLGASAPPGIPRRTFWLDRRWNTTAFPDAVIDLMCVREFVSGAGRRGTYVTGPGPVPPTLPRRPGTIELRLPSTGRSGDRAVDVTIDGPDGRMVEWRTIEGPIGWFALEPGDYRLHAAAEPGAAFEGPVRVVEGTVTRIDAAWSADGAARREAGVSGPVAASNPGFLPISLAISFFFMWAIAGSGHPGLMLRLMAFKNTVTFRRAVITVTVYFSLIYLPLVMIFCCARLLMPGMDLESDRVMPRMAVLLTESIGHAWLAGLLIAAPRAAVMSTVDSYLLVVSSAFVRDIYQRNVNPNVSESSIRRMSHLVTLVIGLAALLGAIHPPQFLQDIIVYSGSGLAACFLAPIVFTIYWPRANRAGCMAGMLAGFVSHLGMYLAGWYWNGSFYKPYEIWNMDPILVGLIVSFAAALVITPLTSPPPAHLVRKYFHAQ